MLLVNSFLCLFLEYVFYSLYLTGLFIMLEISLFSHLKYLDNYLWFLYIRDFRSSDKTGDLQNIFCSKTMLFSSETCFTMVKTKKISHFFCSAGQKYEGSLEIAFHHIWVPIKCPLTEPALIKYPLTEPALMWTLFFLLPYLPCLLGSCLNAYHANSFIIIWEIRNI